MWFYSGEHTLFHAAHAGRSDCQSRAMFLQKENQRHTMEKESSVHLA